MNKPPAHHLNLAISNEFIADLTPFDRNARRHPDRQIKQIMRSIAEFGFVDPVITDDKNNVICGHGALEAAKRLGMSEVPTIKLGHLSPAQIRALVIAHNALAQKSEWARDVLAGEIQGLVELGFDVELTGFDTVEIDTLLSIGEDDGASAADNENVEMPTDQPPVTRVGDHWVFANDHHLLCADARLRSSYETLLAGTAAELVFTDPPFNVKIQGNVSGLGGARHAEFVMGSGELSDAAFVMTLLRPVMHNLVLFCDAGAIAFICSDWRALRHMQDAADGVLHEMKNLIVWAKTNAGMGTFYRSQYELVCAYKVSRGPTINNFELGQNGRRHRSNLWTYPGANTFRRGRMKDLAEHPTVKNRKMVEDAILDCSRRGGIVLDPFLGSGTTLAAAFKTGRRGYGLELDPRYCDVILRRLTELTGTAPRLADGRTFEEVAAERAGEEG